MDELYGRMNDELESMENPPIGSSNIQNFFAAKTIFLTGATGFMGKCFVEKILRDCPDLKRLYVLVRNKKGVPQKDIMKRYFSHLIFDRIRSLDPNFEAKVVTINGDLIKDRLGISAEDRQLLIDEVDVIVHNGATVKFDEIVSVALTINVLATKEMLDLASECKHLSCFTYVSTAYSHCYNRVIEEKFYDSPADLKIVGDMIAADKAAVNGLSKQAIDMLLGKWPNIYVFSKSMAEELVRQYGDKFPCCVYRPSIVSAAWEEPLPGWIGNNNGPAYAFIGTVLGVLHVVPYTGAPVDLVPADYSINALIASIYDCPVRWQTEKKGLVYNFGSSDVAPITLHGMFATVLDEAPRIGSLKQMWHPFWYSVELNWIFYVLHFFFHFLPACLGDLILICVGEKPRALKLFWFGTTKLDKVSYFLNGNWRIRVTETRKILDRMSQHDRQIFAFDMENFDWNFFIVKYIRGARVTVLKEPFDTIPAATKRFRRFYLLHQAVKFIGCALLVYWAIRLFNCLLSVLLV